ncbi:MAG: putative peptidoglycan lipid flippase [Chloroflexota bacterium]|nr:putative peptidoglycan lipid flippase [Chloroflexota bacterium]
METENSQNANSQIARAAGTVMFAFIISNLVGLLAKTLTARAFGTGVESNAFFAANRFSEILFNLVAGGALGSAFIPVFTGLLARDDRKEAWKLASSIVNLVSLVLVVVSLLTMLFSRQVVHYLLAPGFSPEEETLTAQLLRIQVLSSVIFGISGLVMGILNAHQHFLLPALAPAMYQVGWILGIYLLAPVMGVYGLAWGVVIGSTFHLLVQVPQLLKLPQHRYHFMLGLHVPEVREVARLMGPRLLGVAIVQLNFLLNTYLASFQPEGSITAISLAFPLMLMPEAAIAQSVAIASLPTFSMQVARNKLDEMRASLSATLRTVLMLAVPASIGLILLRRPIVSILYEGNEFNAHSTDLVAWALLWYALGLVGHCVVEIISRAFYALHDTRTPVIVGVGAMSLNLALSFAFVALFRALGWMPHGGLALANSTATLLESILLLYLMNRRLKGIDAGTILQSMLKFLLAGALMALLILFLMRYFPVQQPLVRLLVFVAAGVVLYLALMLVMRSSELASLKRIFRRRGS